jgi:hypothetical protein
MKLKEFFYKEYSPTECSEKWLHFEYFLFRIIKWNQEVEQDVYQISVTKAVLLLFFTSSCNNDMLDIFNNYTAAPYGSLEEDIWKNLRKNKKSFFRVVNSCFICEGTVDDLKPYLNSTYCSIIDESIKKLKNLNRKIITYSSWDLMDINKCWYSWAKNNKISISAKIPLNEIKEEDKLYYIP